MSQQVQDLFEVRYGHSLELNKLVQTRDPDAVAFVSRTAKNNGVSAWVKPVTGLQPAPPGVLSVALGTRNYTLETFVQPFPFYSGRDVSWLIPRRQMPLAEKIWWALCVRANRYRYNYGRQANRSLAFLSLPDEVPDWVTEDPLQDWAQFTRPLYPNPSMELGTSTWRPFRLGELFHVERGRHSVRRDLRPGLTPYVSAIAHNNGISARVALPPDFPSGRIVLVCNGNNVGDAFYQNEPFVASGDVAVLSPRFSMSSASALFICALLRKEKYRYNWGRKWFSARIRDAIIRLPANTSGEWTGRG